MFNVYSKEGWERPFTSLTFSGGEEHIRFKGGVTDRYAKIVAHIRSSQDVMKLLLITDALRRQGATDIDLVCPYLPYARQDRVCNSGEALSVKVMCDLINSQGYKSVEIWDAHSDVAPALLNNCINIPQWKFIRQIPNFNDPYYIAPDAGAAKKAHEAAHQLSADYIVARKIRNTVNGEITDTEIDLPKYKYGFRRALIIDDICDGGRTFIELAKKIRKINPNGDINLYVTHGIFSNGLDVLRPYIDHVYTANTFVDLKGDFSYVTVLPR